MCLAPPAALAEEAAGEAAAAGQPHQEQQGRHPEDYACKLQHPEMGSISGARTYKIHV